MSLSRNRYKTHHRVFVKLRFIEKTDVADVSVFAVMYLFCCYNLAFLDGSEMCSSPLIPAHREARSVCDRIEGEPKGVLRSPKKKLVPVLQ